MAYIKLSKQKDLETYEPSAGLKSAMEMAIALGRPLLLSGKPGTGKTQFAHWLAKFLALEDGFNDEPYIFSTKTTSTYTDLFYQYDAVSHFRSKDETKSTASFIELTAFGKAIVSSIGIENVHEEIKPIAKRSLKEIHRKRSVVLIDEVDKAPRDFPNDLLHEIENFSFSIKEIDSNPISLPEDQRQNVVVILTSNFEKNLPDAFLRRCIFYHIEFPTHEELQKIIVKKLSLEGKDIKSLADKLRTFYIIYNRNGIQKPPSTSECIDWINWLKSKNLLDKSNEELAGSLSVLLKNETDLSEARALLLKTI